MRHAAIVLASLLAIGCSASSGRSQRPIPDNGAPPTEPGGGSGGQAPTNPPPTSDGGLIETGSGDGGPSAPPVEGALTEEPECPSGAPTDDGDGDGFTVADGDCNDCTGQMNPGAFDFPGNDVDEDCSGTADDEAVACDASTTDLASGDALEAARAIGLCRARQGASWGLIAARYAQASGAPGMNPLSHGLLPDFGPNVAPREGNRLLALSSGTARRPADPGFASPHAAEMGTVTTTPPGYPIATPACPLIPQFILSPFANDSAALEIAIQVPTNANLMRFEFNFYTYEFPVFICSEYNDFFVALVDPPPAHSQFGNVSFDNDGNPVSVNNTFLEVCNPQVAGNKTFSCPLGSAQLEQTGYDETEGLGPHAATGWLATEVPVTPGTEVRMRFAIWDQGDHQLDSTVLVDNFSWAVKPTSTEAPVTQPIPR